MHVSAVVEISDSLIPALQELHDEMYKKQQAFDKIIKIGRTHLQVRAAGMPRVEAEADFCCPPRFTGRHASDPRAGILGLRSATRERY